MQSDHTTQPDSKSTPGTQLSTILTQAQTAHVNGAGDGSHPAQPRSEAAFDFSQFLTDTGNAQRFAAQHAGALKYTIAHGWLHWDGKRWKTDETGEVFRAARRTVAAMMRDAKDANETASTHLAELAKRLEAGEELADDPTPAIKAAQKRARELQAWAVKSQSKERLAAMIALAQSEPGIAAHAGDFDRDPWLLNCQNGILDLRTGKLSPHDPAAMMTRIAGAAYIPNAPCRTWLSFLERVQPDPEIRTFLQRSIGYALTGVTREKAFWVFHGQRDTGKSIFLGTVYSLMGEYALRAKTESFMREGQAKKGGAANEDIAQFAGRRFVFASETEDSQPLAVGLLKDLTSGSLEPVRARFLHKNSFEFLPTSKIWISGNHLPVITDDDKAIWRRVQLVKFLVHIPEPEQDKSLPQRMLAELDGILAWAVQGCIDWQSDGLATPKVVANATQQYQDDSDLIGQWLGECTKETPMGKAPAKALFESYQKWCNANGLRDMSATALNRKLNERGYEKVRMNYGNAFGGIELLPVDINGTVIV